MDRVIVDHRQEIVKTSTDRLRARLIRAGYNEATVLAYNRQELMEAYAEYSLLVTPTVEPQGAFVGVGAPVEQDDPEEEDVLGEPETEERPDVAEAAEMTELELRRRELWLREREFGRQKEKDEAERKERAAEKKAERELRRMEFDLRKMELDRQKEKDKKEEEQRERQKKKDDKEKARRESLVGQTRFYGDALKHSLPKMPVDPVEFPSYFRAVENLFTLYEVPKNLQSKLLIPTLNERSKTLLAKLPKESLDDYDRVKAYLLREFKLTAEKYRDKFWTATKTAEETFTLFGLRVKNLFQYYLDSRKVANFDDLIDLLVSDRIKQTLSDACLKHVCLLRVMIGTILKD